MASELSRIPSRFVPSAALAALATFMVLTSTPTVRGHEAGEVPPKLPSAANVKAMNVKEIVATVCASCHGPTGNSAEPDDPKLAGQKELYLRLQLRGFKYGARKSDEMTPIAALLSDTQIDGLARFYSRQKVEPDKITDRQLADLGRRVFNYPGRGTPPCAACHSPAGFSPGFGPGMMGPGMMHGGMGGHMGMGMGMMRGNTALVPKVFGQHAEYTAKQLDAFANGKRRGQVMGPIAARLTPRERRAVAEYLAGRR